MRRIARGCLPSSRGAEPRAYDPAFRLMVRSVTSQMGMTFTGDARDIALREALYSALQIS